MTKALQCRPGKEKNWNMFDKMADIGQQAVYKDRWKILRQLESDLKKFDKIFLVLGEEKLLDDFWELLCDLEVMKEKRQRVLVLASPKRRIGRDTSVMYRQITEGESKQLCSLYSMYEFSDRFQIVSGETRFYGSLFQLVDVGLLSLRESVSALLH